MRYGIIGNCKTAALVHETGNIEWCCMPNFDSPSLFGQILDQEAGHFSIKMYSTSKVHQKYVHATNILETYFDDGENAFVIIDFMPRYRNSIGFKRPIEIHRILRPLKGRPVIQVDYQPQLNYARDKTVVTIGPSVITASNKLEDIFLYSSLSLTDIAEKKRITLTQDHFLLLTYHEKINQPTFEYSWQLFEQTKEYWETWAAHCRLPSLYGEEVLRSALVLKLMTFEDTGAIIAAPTTSLPESIGDERNWDYRYCWLRDASLMLEALKSVGHFEEAKAFIHFLLKIFESKQSKVQIMYGIDGRTNLQEKTLVHLKGYKNSWPVRIGNQASRTQQNDIFGEMLHTLYLYYFKYQFEKMTDDVWSLVKFLVSTIAKEWHLKDAGIWEFRHRKMHFTFSKILSWVAVDRGIKIANSIGKNYISAVWQPLANTIHKDIEVSGWSDTKQAYTQAYGSPNFDASLMLMHQYGFLKSDDPRWISTVLNCEVALVNNGYGFRYTSADDFGKPKSAFIVASLWIAKALCSIGQKERGRVLFENVLAKMNHVGLLSEDIDPSTGQLLGNFPQAYSHMAVINTANLLNN